MLGSNQGLLRLLHWQSGALPIDWIRYLGGRDEMGFNFVIGFFLNKGKPVDIEKKLVFVFKKMHACDFFSIGNDYTCEVCQKIL
jgi:hypothetical protein